MWRSVWRTTPACSEVWKEISAPVPTISSVEPPPMSTTSVGSVGGVLRGGAQVGEPRLLLAVEDPGREREALPQLGDEGAAVLGVADGAGRDRVDRLGAQLLDRRRRTRRSPRRRPRSPRPRAARRGRPRAPAASPCCAARPATPCRRRRRRPAAAPSWCRRRSPRPCWEPSGMGRHSRARPSREVACANAASQPQPSAPLLPSLVRRGVEQPGSSSGS